MLPEDARRRIVNGAGSLGTQLDDEQVDRLLAHLLMLQKWGQVYNLTALKDPSAMLQQHLLDSLGLIAPLRRHLGSAGQARLLDVGSGAGFPGLTVATAAPEISVVCVDSVGKKVGFMRQVIGELKLANARADQGRIELLAPAAAQVITSRAFASLFDFVTLTRRHLAPGGCWVAMKGVVPDAEIEALPADVAVFHVEQVAVPGLDAARCLVWMRAAG